MIVIKTFFIDFYFKLVVASSFQSSVQSKLGNIVEELWQETPSARPPAMQVRKMLNDFRDGVRAARQSSRGNSAAKQRSTSATTTKLASVAMRPRLLSLKQSPDIEVAEEDITDSPFDEAADE